MNDQKKILIVGGGYTGLTAALRLSADGKFDVTVVESANDLGGLAGGFQIQGTSLEKTYHHLFLTDTSILNLVKELGIEDKLLWCDSSMGIFRNGKIHPFKTPVDLLTFSPVNFLGRLRTGFTAFYLKHQKNWRGLTRQTAHEWMTRACGRSAMDAIWTPLLKGKFDRYYDKVSMAWLWARIHTRANSRSSGGGGEKLGYFRGGFDVITTALEKKLRENGVVIKTGTTVEKFLAGEKAAIINGEKTTFDFCIFTGPSGALARLLPPEKSLEAYATQLRSIGYLGAICLIFTSEQSLGNYYWVNINEPGAPFLVFIQHTNLVGRETYGGKNVYYLGAYLDADGEVFGLPNEQLAERWLSYLPKMFPHFDPKQIKEKFFFRFRGAQHIVDTAYEEKISPSQTPLPGVYLANFSQVFPEDRGTNFAVREGEKIAAVVRASAG